jgi:photosystem II stability/assembly factor-like uncharacterized protein
MGNRAYVVAVSFAVLSIPVSAGWMNVSNGLTGSVPGVTALAIDRSTGSTLYALTSTNGIFKSTDTGANWKALGNIAEVSVLALDPTAASRIYAGTPHGVVTSTDGGENWSSAGLVSTPISVVAVDPLTPSTLYAGGNGNVYKSADRGASWTELNLGPPPGTEGLWIAGLALDPLTPSTLYVAVGMGAGGNLLKSMDGGASWNVIYANAGPFYNTSSNLVIDPSTPSTLYRINPLKKSTDGGVSWTGLTEPMKNDLALTLAVDPRNSNTLYLATITNTGKAIYKSTDRGQSWNAVDTIIPAANSFVFSPDVSTLYAATAGGVFKSTDAGLNWGETNTGLRVLSIRVLVGDPANPATTYAGGDQGLFKSVDGGANWKSEAAFVLPAAGPFGPGPAEVHSLLIDFTNPDIQYIVTARPGGCDAFDVLLFKSTDGGTTWNDLSPTTDDHQPLSSGCAIHGALAMDPIDPATLYLPYGDDYDGFTILKTTDGGASWKDLYVGLLGDVSSVNALWIDPNTPSTLYAATDLGVLRSTDGGTSFLPTRLANTPVAFLAIDPLRPNVFYAATANNPYPFDSSPPGLVGLYKSTDSGATWLAINQGLDEIIATHPTVTELLVDADRSDTLYLATSGHGVFKSTDGGATWAAFNDGLTSLDVRSLALSHRGSARHRGSRPAVLNPNTLYAGTPGGVFKIQ